MKRFRHKKENYWVSLADIMTGLMLIFMFIAITYIHQVNADQKKREEKHKKNNMIIQSLQDTRKSLYEELEKQFKDKFKKWDMKLEKDLTIRFLNKKKVMFDYDKWEIKDEFKGILDEFFPKYINILLDRRFRDRIAEIRIEGHTDSHGTYLYNVELSQKRTASVLRYLIEDPNSPYLQYPKKDKAQIRFWVVAAGFSYGRTIDENFEFTFLSSAPENQEQSRRVEFRIITKTEETVKAFLEKVKSNGF